jgi:hypothetical protein
MHFGHECGCSESRQIQIRDNQAEFAGELRLLNHAESFYGIGDALNVVEPLFQHGDTSKGLKWIITN